MIYTVQKGKHRFTPFWWRNRIEDLFTNTIQGVAILNQSCKYTLDGGDQSDWNKLIGITTSWNHHKQSIRIGWRWNPQLDVFELAPYLYDGGVLFLYNGSTVKVPVSTSIIFSIKVFPTSYKVVIYSNREVLGKFNIGKFNMKKQNVWWWPFRYINRPYFGGNRVAPHNMKLLIERV